MEETGSDTAYQDYYRHVELHWSLQRDRQIIVSPVEFEAVESWYEAGVPLAVVLEAIHVFIERKKKAKRQRGFLLNHVDGAVVKLFTAYQTLHEGEGEEGDLLAAKLRKLMRKIQALRKSFPAEITFLDEIRAALAAVDPSQIVRYEDLDQQLIALDDRLVSHFKGQLPEQERAAIEQDVRELLSEEEDNALFEKLVRDSVRAHFALPRLTLLG